jgi:DNA-binding LacI/PurR family transcriptional regulator
MPRPNQLFCRFFGQIRQQVISGFAPGEKLPSAREWARMYGISERTVRRVLRELAAQGLLRILPRLCSMRAGAKRSKPATPRKRALRVGLISGYSLDERYSFSSLLKALAERRGIGVVPVPHRLAIRPTATQNRFDFSRVPWNDFDVGLLVSIPPSPGIEPILRQHRVLSVDGDSTRTGIDSVCFDSFEAGWMLAEYLFDLGHRLFAVTDNVNPPGWPSSTEWTARRHGFEACLARLGGCVRPTWRMETHQYYQPTAKGAVPLRRIQMIRSAACAWGAMKPGHRPTALFAPEASMLEGIDEFARQGLPIPRQLSLVTCAWRKMDLVQLGLRLTHIWYDQAALANRALDAAEDLARGKRTTPWRQLLSRDGKETSLYTVLPLLVPADSTAPPPPL